MDSSPLGVLLALLGSFLAGGNDLLDAVPTDAYWAARGVEVTVDRMIDVLNAPPPDVAADATLLWADDPDARRKAAYRLIEAGPAAVAKVRPAADSPTPATAELAKEVLATIARRPRVAEVRRLMAIRALGELGDPRGLPAVEAAGRTPGPFVADYAAAAAARIQRRPHARPAPAAGGGRDVDLLPAGCRFIAHVAAGAAGPAAVHAATEAGVPDADRRADFVKAIAPQVEALAEGLGNVRLEGLTLGLSGDPTADPPTAAVVLLARCAYDRPAARAWLENHRLAVREMAGGAPGVDLGPELTLLLPSDRHVALLAAADPKRLPTAELTKAVAAGRGPLADARGPIADWLRKNDPKHPAWAVGYFSPADHAAGVPEGVDWVAGHGQWSTDPPAAAGLDVRLMLTGRKVESIHAAADAVAKAVEPFRKPPEREDDLSMTEALTARLAARVGVSKSPTGAEVTLKLVAADVLAAAERAARRAKE